MCIRDRYSDAIHLNETIFCAVGGLCILETTVALNCINVFTEAKETYFVIFSSGFYLVLRAKSQTVRNFLVIGDSCMV